MLPGSTPGATADASLVLDADLSALNTFGLHARAARLLRVRSVDALRAAIGAPGWSDTPRLVLGGGSNLVLGGDYAGTVLRVEIPGRRLLRTEAEAWIVEAGAGEDWHDFVRWTLAQGWPGLENLSLIPGTVGAAPIQNIGAYGLELVERFDSLDAVELDSGELRSFDAAACAFGYRDSVFKRNPGKWLVAAVRFRLPRPWRAVTRYADVTRELEACGLAQPSALEVSDAVIAIRRRKLPDPAVLGNAGSFFKNPVVDAARCTRLLAEHPALPHYPQADGREKLAAGWLIEQAGWKGRNLGPVGCYERQALVLVNRGGATGGDVRRIAQAIIVDVEARFGVRLEPEPVFV
ncbi:UDP-N-acetylmuramate dehydrogenase [Thauera sp.]|jgi:UDP-N-acetylmuramate dehydrogenase|uniref:UDP-N-acetylmuramate dehydrogenase n=1 Tax=Thauera sp. TaxID=1905334 RepID=UPI002D18541E|nr:UDP-N-acetylmuramate dehydrogenase [Thauera sp.]HRO34737.1 UDP-N-acetylmuramate dehydrogenase [Thauera sp.]